MLASGGTVSVASGHGSHHMYTPGYGARDSPSARTVVGRDHAYDMGPVVTYDMVADDSGYQF